MALLAGTARGQLFVASDSSGTIGEYTTSGTTVNGSLISGLHDPFSLGVLGNDLFVAYYFGGDNIGEYTTSGTTVNAELIVAPAGFTSLAVEQVPEPVSWAVVGLGLAVLFGGAWVRHCSYSDA